MTSNHYLTIKNDSEDGNIFVIGDVHGAVDTLKATLKKLTPNDKLVIVGDLVDRGVSLETNLASSADVLDFIIENNKQAQKKQAPYIYSIKGNHEEDVLFCISMLLEFKAKQKENPLYTIHPNYIEMLVGFIGNGGGWIFNNPEHRNEFNGYSQLNTSYRETYKPNIRKLLTESLEHSDTLINNIDEYKTFLNDLSYIIKIEDKSNSAWVAHADLPFTDIELNTKIANGENLTKNEISHLTNAREVNFSQKRSENMDLVYCGHNPIGLMGTVAVRTATNHINLDSAAYCYSATLLMNHTLGIAEIISAPGARHTSTTPYIAHLELLDKSKNEIEHHLKTQRMALKQSESNNMPTNIDNISNKPSLAARDIGIFSKNEQNKRKAPDVLSEDASSKKGMF